MIQPALEAVTATQSSDPTATASAVFAGISAVAGIAAAIVAWWQARVAIRVARRQNIFSLNAMWAPVNELNCENLVGPDVRSAVNALEFTAACWHEDVVEKSLIAKLYWPQYRALYDVLIKCDAVPPGYDKPCREYMSEGLRKAYMAIKEYVAKGVPLTSTT